MAEDNDGDVGAFLAGFVVGGLVGAAAALIMAPRSGEQTRAQIASRGEALRQSGERRFREYRSVAEQYADQAQEQARIVLDEGRERMTGAMERGQRQADELAEESKEKLGEAIDEAQRKADEAAEAVKSTSSEAIDAAQETVDEAAEAAKEQVDETVANVDDKIAGDA